VPSSPSLPLEPPALGVSHSRAFVPAAAPIGEPPSALSGDCEGSCAHACEGRAAAGDAPVLAVVTVAGLFSTAISGGLTRVRSLVLHVANAASELYARTQPPTRRSVCAQEFAPKTSLEIHTHFTRHCFIAANRPYSHMTE
jgi:modification target Cys-rich repeat protein